MYYSIAACANYNFHFQGPPGIIIETGEVIPGPRGSQGVPGDRGPPGVPGNRFWL